MNVVKLEAGNRASMANQTTVNLSASQIPESNHTISSTASQSRLEDLQSANEVGRSVGRTAGGGLPPGTVTATHSSGLGSGPHDVQGLHTATLSEIPLTKRLISGTRDENISPEVQSSNLVQMGLQSEEGAISHASSRWVHSMIIRVNEGKVLILLVDLLATLRIVMGLAQVPKLDCRIHRASSQEVIFDLKSADGCRVAFESTDTASSVQVPNTDGVIHSSRNHKTKRSVEVESRDIILVRAHRADHGAWFEVFVENRECLLAMVARLLVLAGRSVGSRQFLVDRLRHESFLGP